MPIAKTNKLVSLPIRLLRQIKREAKKNGRSANEEINVRLEQSFYIEVKR